MSAKWIASQKWEQENLTGFLTPVRYVLHALSTIWLAVTTLVLLSLYGTLASVPIGMLALIPTYLIYGLTILLAIGVLAIVPWLVVFRAMRGLGSSTRFVMTVIVLVALIPLAVFAWHRFVWPSLHYDPITGGGFRLFGEFVDRYRTETVRRLPGMEMTELEFYAWWPLNLLLYLFVTNMVVATIRRIDFTFPKLGVLMVHTGIVTIALGSAYYASNKREGDMLLIAGPPGADGAPSTGRPEVGFFDNTRVVLHVRQERSVAEQVKLGIAPERQWEMRALRNVPRYNDYNLNVVQAALLAPGPVGSDEGRTLDLEVVTPRLVPGAAPFVDPDIAFRVVGYASYCELRDTFTPAPAPKDGPTNPLRFVELLSTLNDEGKPTQPEPGTTLTPRVMEILSFVPKDNAQRSRQLSNVMAVEYSMGMAQSRWEELSAPLPDGAMHGLIVEIPALAASDGAVMPGLSRIYAVAPGQVIEAKGGAGVWKIEVRQILPEPPFPIITPGYQGSTSPVVVVRITPPAGVLGGKSFDRYVYGRYPELNQDLLEGVTADGRQSRRAADPSIKLTYIDASIVSVHFDESSAGKVRAMVRLPRSSAQILTNLDVGSTMPVAPGVSMRLGPRVEHARSVKVPSVVPMEQRNKDNIGNHRRAAIAVEVRELASAGAQGLDSVKARQTVWLPFRQYLGLDDTEATRVTLSDGRKVDLVFGRQWWPLDGMSLSLANFEMFPYPHSTQPRDFRSDVLVMKPTSSGRQVVQERYTSLNDPLLESPFVWDQGRSTFGNAFAWLGAKLGTSQYKFSQTGWDSQGWTETKVQVDAGQLPRPYARFTILGVGNNPGIYVIAFGSVLMSIGIPWAFYLKPWLVQREKKKIQAALAAGTYVKPTKKRTGLPLSESGKAEQNDGAKS